MSRRSLIPAVVLLTAVAAHAATPEGPEIQIHTYTTGHQSRSAVAVNPAGGFVVVWQDDGRDGSGYGIIAQRYDALGSPLGGEIQANTHTTGDQSHPAVAVKTSGEFLVVWASYGQDGMGNGVFGRRFDAAGAPQSGELQVNTYTTGPQGYPDVSWSESGGFVVVWDGYGPLGSDYDVLARRYNDAGAPQGDEFLVNTGNAGFQGNAAVAANAAGRFVIVWEDCCRSASLEGIFGRRFDAAGTPLEDDFQVDTGAGDNQGFPDVALDVSGNFLVAWEAPDGYGMGIAARRFDDAGNPEGGDFTVNSYLTGNQWYPQVAADGDEGFVVVWESPQDGWGRDVFGKELAWTGLVEGQEFQVNTYTTGHQGEPAVSTGEAGRFVVTWTDLAAGAGASQDGDQGGIFGQRLTATARPDLVSTALCAGTAHYAWVRFEDGGANPNIAYRSCAVGGSCSEAQVLVSEPTLEVAPEVACAGTTVLVAWEDTRQGNKDLFYRRSIDGGVTFGGLQGLVSAPTDEQNLALVMEGGVVLAAWEDRRQGNSHIALKRSTDGGASFGGVTFVVSADTDETHPAMALDGNDLVVAWEDARKGNIHLAYRQSTDGGVSFGPLKFLVSSSVDETRPALGRNGNLIVAAWEDPRRGNVNIFSRRSLDGGDAWGALFAVVSAETEEARPVLAMEGDTLLIAWEDRRAGNSHIAYRRSVDGGVMYGPLSFLVSASTDELSPACDLAGGQAVCVWADTRSGTPLPIARESQDGGLTWSPLIWLD